MRLPAPRSILAPLSLLAGLATLACRGRDVPGLHGSEVSAAQRIIVGPRHAVLTPGLSQQMLAVVQDAAGRPLDSLVARWHSSDERVARVTARGLVTADRPGTATLTASVGAVRTQATVTVRREPVTSSLLLEHRDVVATVFWVGEGADASNEYISNAMSAFDEQWQAHYGGVDAPSPRRGHRPAAFTPKENPFYFALPYTDLDEEGKRKANAMHVVPWAASAPLNPWESMVKNRWIRVTARSTGVSCYAQWEDAGPGIYDDFQYVFGSAAPSNPFVLSGTNLSSAIDLSPATRDCLEVRDGVFRVDWRFVADADVPLGPWKEIVTTRR